MKKIFFAAVAALKNEWEKIDTVAVINGALFLSCVALGIYFFATL